MEKRVVYIAYLIIAFVILTFLWVYRLGCLLADVGLVSHYFTVNHCEFTHH